MRSAPPTRLQWDSIALFLDFDGTLVEFRRDPNSTFVSALLLDALAILQRKLDGALAVVTGRPFTQIASLLRPLAIPVAAQYGVHLRDAHGIVESSSPEHDCLHDAAAQLQAAIHRHPALKLEIKPGALVVHYRQAPHLREFAHNMLSRVAAPLRPAFEVLLGDGVVEIKPAGACKGNAVMQFMRQPPFAARTPIYLGDDETDIDGFDAVETLGGFAVGISSRVSARYYLPDPRHAREWLMKLAR